MRREDVFPRLDPPPGGLAGLRRKMLRRERRARVAIPLAAAIAIAAAALLVFRRAPPDLSAAAMSRGGAGMMELGLAPMPSSPVTLSDDERGKTALSRVPTANEKVAFYWVSSTGWQER